MGNSSSVQTSFSSDYVAVSRLVNQFRSEYRTNVETYTDALNDINLDGIVVSGDRNKVAVSVTQIASAAAQMSMQDVLTSMTNTDMTAEQSMDVMATLISDAQQTGGIASRSGSTNSTDTAYNIQNYIELKNEIVHAVNIINRTAAANKMMLGKIVISGNENEVSVTTIQDAKTISSFINDVFTQIDQTNGMENTGDFKYDSKTKSFTEQTGTTAAIVEDVSDTISDVSSDISSSFDFLKYGVVGGIVIVVVIIVGIIMIFYRKVFNPPVMKGGRKTAKAKNNVWNIA